MEYRVTNMYKSFKIDEKDPLIKCVINVFENIGIKPYVTSTGGGSDANIFNTNGIKAINLGTGMTKAHTLEEHIHVESLIKIGNTAMELMLRRS